MIDSICLPGQVIPVCNVGGVVRGWGFRVQYEDGSSYHCWHEYQRATEAKRAMREFVKRHNQELAQRIAEGVNPYHQRT